MMQQKMLTTKDLYLEKIINPLISIDCDCWPESHLLVHNNKCYFGTFGFTFNGYDIDTTQTLFETNVEQEVESLVVTDDHIIGAGHGYIHYFNKETGEIIHKFEHGHTSCVRSLINYNNLLISGSKEIKIWNIKTRTLVRTLDDHPKLVQSMIIKNDYLVSGSDDDTIKVWDLNSGELLRTFIGHTYSVNSLDSFANIIISGSGDDTIKYWDFNTGECIKTLIGHAEWINTVKVYGRFLISCSHYEIRVWDLMMGICLKVINSYEDQFEDLQIIDHYIVTINRDGFMHKWDLNNLITNKSYSTGSIIDQSFRKKVSRINKIYLSDPKYFL